MRNPDFWRSQWSDVPDYFTEVDAANEKKEQRGFITVATWPLILLILQGAIYAPLYATGFLSSPFENDQGIYIEPTPQDPNVIGNDDGVTVNPDEKQQQQPAEVIPDTPLVTPTPSPVNGNTGTTPGSNNPGTNNPNTTNPGQNNPTPGTGDTGNTPNPATPPEVKIPEDVKIDLTKDSSEKSIGTTAIKLFPGQANTFTASVGNTGNVPLGSVNLKVSASNPLFADASQGLTVFVWSCDSQWGGSLAKPVCNSGMKTTSAKVSAGALSLPFSLSNPGDRKYMIVSVQLPTSADDKYQGQSTSLSFTASATQTGGVVK